MLEDDNFFDKILLNNDKSNYKLYRKEALEWIQELSGNLWSDYNSHDPGITILEVLCYVLTEFDYKLGFSIEDILASSSEKFRHKQNAMFMPNEVFKVAPVTILDYRKIIIDRIDEVNNVWIIPDIIEGYFNVSLVLNTNEDDYSVVDRVRKLLNKYESFGVYFKQISIIERKECTIKLSIEIDKNSEPEKIIKDVLKLIERKLCNLPPNKSSFKSLESEGLKYEDIYDGPTLNNGFITDLPNLYQSTELNILNLKKYILNINSLNAVNELVFYIDGKSYDKAIPINNHILSINYQESSFFIVEDEHRIDFTLDNFNDNFAEHKKHITVQNNFYKIPEGKNRNIAKHISIKEEFPRIYFANTDASIQFEGFLKLFDLFFENKLTIISELSTFFNIDSTDSNVFISLEKRESFLNHLLSRFSISFSDNIPYYYGKHKQKNKFLKHQIACKEELLKNYIHLTSNRSIFSLDSISALENELYLKLWILNPPKKPLFKVIEKYFDEKNSDNVIYLKNILKTGLEYNEYELKDNLENTNVILNKQFNLGSDKHIDNPNIIQKYIEHFRKINIESEGFYMIPNIHFDYTIKNEEYTFEKGANFELTFIFSAWSSRFQSYNFKEQVKKCISDLIPAHMVFRCLWLDYFEIKTFEKLYFLWKNNVVKDKQSEVSIKLSSNLKKMLDELASFQDERG